MSFDLFRKPMHCYILLSIWILLLVGGIYKFLERNPTHPVSSDAIYFENSLINFKLNEVLTICNLPEEMTLGDEGISASKQWMLKGLLILTRHGDRGPLQHVTNISNLNCGHKELDLRLKSYQEYLHNLTVLGKVSWIGPGSFHGFPILPLHTTQCQIGQLTMQGISQLLKLGHILRYTYSKSALAFLYTFVLGDVLNKITISESQSMSFCFKDCGCPIADKLYRLVKKDISQQQQLHPAISLLSEITGRLVFTSSAEQGSLGADPYSVRDALLTYICHSTNLPCSNLHNCVKAGPILVRFNSNYCRKYLDFVLYCVKGFFGTILRYKVPSQIIYIRKRFINIYILTFNLPMSKVYSKQNVANIFSYTDWTNHQKWDNAHWKRYCLLKSYGLIKHIVSQMLHMVSNTGQHLILYSGHDHTLEQLSTALGLKNDPSFLRYASRMIIEVYNDNRQPLDGVRDMYFRILTNGKDVTNQAHFCKELVIVTRNTYLCKIEDIVRFIHDDYFASLNVTNFKDACVITKIS